MSLSIQQFDELSPDDLAGWKQLQRNAADRPPFDSAFFHPELARLCDGVLNDLRIAVLRDGDTPTAILPFRMSRSGVAQAPTGRLTEYQGVIGRFDHLMTATEFARQAGISSFHFDHLPADSPGFEHLIWGTQDSLTADLSRGYDAWRSILRSRGSSMTQAERKGRKLEREVGPLRFEFHTTDDTAFRALLKWKTAQHQRSHVLQVLEIPWVRQLLDAARHTRTDGFGGCLSTLHAGSQLVAVHLGLCSDTAFHIWFPAYNTDFDKYSPGLVLLLKMAEAAAGEGLRRIDFGRGGERYKLNFSTDSLKIAEGAIDRRAVISRLHRGWFRTKRWMRSSRFRKQLEFPLDLTRRLRQRLAFS